MSANSPRLAGDLLRGGRVYIWLTLVSLLVATLTVLWPSTPSYDPWSWLIWGRQILHGHLELAGGPSWKPLPVIFTTVFALLKGYQPDLWLIVARAGLVMSLLLIFRLTFRLSWDLQSRGAEEAAATSAVSTTGGLDGGNNHGALPGAMAALRDRSWRWIPPLFAALLAAVGLCLTGPYFFDTAVGYSEGLAIAGTLLAFERLYDGHHRQAFALGLLAVLDRPEACAFWLPYGVWIMWKDPGARSFVIGLVVLTVLIWLIPSRLGSDSFSSAITRSRFINPGQAANSACPFCKEATKFAFPEVAVQVIIAAALAGITALILSLRELLPWPGPQALTARRRAMLLLAGAAAVGFGWWLIVCIDVQLKFSGNQRYLMVGSALIWMVGSTAFGWAALELSALGGVVGRDRARQVVLASMTAVAMLLFVPKWLGQQTIDLRYNRLELMYQAHLRTDVSAVLKRLGTPRQALACGTVMAEHFQIPMVAWYLKVPISTILDTPGEWKKLGAPRPLPHGGWPNVIVQAAAITAPPLEPTAANISHWEALGARYTVIHDDRVTLYKDCERA